MSARNLIKVECYSGARADEEPRRLVFADAEIDVAEIENRWREPDGERWRVLGEDGFRYEIRRDAKAGLWRLVGIEPS